MAPHLEIPTCQKLCLENGLDLGLVSDVKTNVSVSWKFGRSWSRLGQKTNGTGLVSTTKPCLHHCSMLEFNVCQIIPSRLCVDTHNHTDNTMLYMSTYSIN